MVGRRRGKLASGTPRSGLRRHLDELFAELGLPRAEMEAQRMRLDPLRAWIDRRRHVAVSRLGAAGVHYAVRDDGDSPSGVTIGATWKMQWTAATEASVELAGARGVTAGAGREGGPARRSEAHRNRGGVDHGGASLVGARCR